ncbi:hypothetical protein H0H87_008204 [Tephrocybe sp. NHM501043]|nr:hypothetical protein H0H87_008204 [Tephrocybe sp. NHM501043]
MPPPLCKALAIKCNVHADLKATFCYGTAATKRVTLILHPHKFVSAMEPSQYKHSTLEDQLAITCFMAGIDLTIADEMIFMYLADVPPLASFLDSLLHISNSLLALSNHTFKSWYILGNSISQILKDCKAAWEKEREKERLKEIELECHAAQASKE